MGSLRKFVLGAVCPLHMGYILPVRDSLRVLPAVYPAQPPSHSSSRNRKRAMRGPLIPLSAAMKRPGEGKARRQLDEIANPGPKARFLASASSADGVV